MNAANLLQQAWENEQIPILNGVAYPDGRWIPFVTTAGGVRVGPMKSWDVSSFCDNLTYFTELSRARIEGSSLDVVAGEGGLGTDGAIALIDRHTNELRWVVFSETSNPFECVSVVYDQIHATTNTGVVWNFGIADQTKISIRS